MSKNLTKRQAGVYLFIVDYIDKNHYPPTVREIADSFAIRSTNGVVEHLKALARKGFIEKDSFRSRAIHPLVERQLAVDIMNGIAAPPVRLEQPNIYPRGPLSYVSTTKRIPIIGRIAAGAPILAEENYEDFIEVNPAVFAKSDDEIYALRVRGTSMTGDGILPGDIVVVRTQQHAENGELIAAMIDGSATVKRYEKRKNEIHLIPSNPDMEPIVLKGEDMENFQILGSIRGVIRVYH